MAPTSSQIFTSSGFPLERGGALAELVLAFETYGTLAPEGDNAILLCHGYTSSQHAAGDTDGWWHDLIGEAKTIDTRRYFVVSANMIVFASPLALFCCTWERIGASSTAIESAPARAKTPRAVRGRKRDTQGNKGYGAAIPGPLSRVNRC